AHCAFWEGRYEQAAGLAEGMIKDPRLVVTRRFQPLLVLGRVRSRRGEEQAWAPLDEALALALETGELERVGPVAAARAEAAWLLGDLERTREEARSAFDLAVARN